MRFEEKCTTLTWPDPSWERHTDHEAKIEDLRFLLMRALPYVAEGALTYNSKENKKLGYDILAEIRKEIGGRL